MRINKDLMRSLGLGLLSAQTGPSRTPITGWQTFGKGLASGFDLYNNKTAQRLKELQALGELQMKHAVSKQLGIPVSPALRALEASLSKRVGLSISGDQPLPVSPAGRSAEPPVRGATLASSTMATPTTQPTSAINGSPISPTLDAYKSEVRRNALAKMAGIPYVPPIKPETTTLYNKDSGRPITVAQADAQQLTDSGKWLTFNEAEIAREEQADTKNVILTSRLKETSATMKEHRASVGVARNMITTLSQMEALAAKADTGPGQQTINTIRGFADLLGIDVDAEKLAAGQGLQAFSNQLAMFLRNPDSGGGLPGSASNKDLDFLIAATPGLLKVPGANQILFRSMKAVAQRKIDLAKLAAELRAENPNGVLTAKARKKILELADADLFTPEEREQITSAEALGNKSRREAPPKATNNQVYQVDGGGTIEIVND